MSLGSKTKALKRRITGGVSDVLSAPARSRASKAKRIADYEVGIIRKNRDIKRRGFQDSKSNMQGATGDRRTVAEYQRIKDKYKR